MPVSTKKNVHMALKLKELTVEKKIEFAGELVQALRATLAESPAVDSNKVIMRLQKELLSFSPKRFVILMHEFERSRNNSLANLIVFLEGEVEINKYKLGMLHESPEAVKEIVKKQIQRKEMHPYALVDESQFDYLFRQREGGSRNEKDGFIEIYRVLMESERKEITKKEMERIFKKALNVKRDDVVANRAAEERLTKILADLVNSYVLVRK